MAALYFVPIAVLAFTFNVILLLALPAIALAALVLGIIAIVKTSARTARGRGLAVTAVVLAGIELAFAALAFPAINHGREIANRVKCGANMRQIGMAMFLYANENRGAYPPRLEDLLLTQDITREVFVCPSSHDSPAPGDTAQQQIAKLSAGGHLSYIYLGKGMKSTAGSNVILLYEPLTDHKQGFNVLFGDGRAEFIAGPTAQKVLSELQAGKNPPPSYQGRF